MTSFRRYTAHGQLVGFFYTGNLRADSFQKPGRNLPKIRKLDRAKYKYRYFYDNVIMIIGDIMSDKTDIGSLAGSRLAAMRRPKQRNCLLCGVKFTTVGRGLYCSEGCRCKAYRIRKANRLASEVAEGMEGAL
jgi:hypothetical protein